MASFVKKNFKARFDDVDEMANRWMELMAKNGYDLYQITDLDHDIWIIHCITMVKYD